MANISYPQLIHNIGVAIKEKAGLDSLKYGEMAQAIEDIPSGDSAIVYTSIIDNGDNTITAIDKDGTEHTIAYTFDDDGKIISVSLDGKNQTVTYDENGVLTSIGDTDVNVETVPVAEEGAGGLDYTVTFKTDENTTYQITSVNEGGQVSEPVEPPMPEVRQSFIGWYTTDDVPQQVSFPYTPISNIELKAEFSNYRTYLEQTTTDYFIQIGSYKYKKTYNDISILGYTNRDENSAYSNPLFVSKIYNGAKLTRNTDSSWDNPKTLTYKGETWYYFWGAGHTDDVTVLIPNVVNMNKQQGFSNLLSAEEVALILIKIYLGELPLITE